MAILNTLPEMSDAYPLTEAQIQEFQSQGHTILQGLCTPEEIGQYQPLFADAVEKRAYSIAPMEERDTYGKAFLQIMNLWTQEPALRRFVLAKRFAQVAAELMGVKSIRLYHDQALYKEAGGGFTPWHQDQHYWPLDTDKTITMWMPLVDITESMGTMNFASGSHEIGYLGDLPISDESESMINDLVNERGYTLTNHGAMKAGDATFHYGWTLHGAPGNNSNRTREVITIIYFADGARCIEPDNIGRTNDLKTWLPGCKPGDLAASELNPVLYESDL